MWSASKASLGQSSAMTSFILRDFTIPYTRGIEHFQQARHRIASCSHAGLALVEDDSFERASVPTCHSS